MIITVFTIIRIKQKTDLVSEVIFHSFFQISISYCFWLLLFLQGFFNSILFVFIVLPVGLIIALVYFLYENEYSLLIDGIIKIEGIKNNIIILMLTVLPLYIFMTIFRFLPWYLEISLSLVLTVLIFLISVVLRSKTEAFWQNSKIKFMNSGAMKFVIIWGIFGFLLFWNMVFNLPLNGPRKALNLEQSAPYFVFGDLPADIQNNYKQEPLERLELSNLPEGNNGSFYVLDDYLFINRINYDHGKNYIDVYSITQETLINTHELDFNELDDESKNFADSFLYNDGNLYFGDKNGLYILDENNCTKLSENNPNFFYDSADNLKVLFAEDIYNRKIYDLNGDSLVLDRNLTIDDYNQYGMFTVISKTLFYDKNGIYYLEEDPTVNFSNPSGYLEYDAESKTLYSVTNESIIKYNNNSETILMEYKYREIEDVGFYDRKIMVTDKEQLDKSKVIILDVDSEEFALYNFTDNGDNLLDSRNYGEYIVSFQNRDSETTYLQIDKLKDTSVLQIYRVAEKANDLKLPFYTHYGILTLIWIFVGIFIPVTDDIKYVTYIGFDTVTKKD
jgi:hypothetical protein